MNDIAMFVAAAIQGLCAAPEVSTRKPDSIAKKAVQIAQAAAAELEKLPEAAEY